MKVMARFTIFLGIVLGLFPFNAVCQDKQPTNKLYIMLREAVEDNDPLTVLTILKVINELGLEAPAYDLCQLGVPQMDLFCKRNLGIRRLKMPQFIGKPRAGSRAAVLVQNQKGEVDATAQFKEALGAKGYTLSSSRVPAIALKATQNELIGSKIAGMWWALKKDENHPGIRAPIFISQDNYILDGHHRWAAVVGMDFEDGKLGNVMMDVVKINMPMKDLVQFANQFVNEFGILPAEGIKR